MTTRQESQRRVEEVAKRAASRNTDTTRHRCFVSYHVDDEIEVAKFLDDFGDQFIATVVGVTANDDFVNSDDNEYIMYQIRKRYLGNTTVTIVLVGACTRTRKFVDWEVYSSLRRYEDYAPSGLVAINLPSLGNTGRLPDRVSDNVHKDEKYARYWTYPSSKAGARNNVDIAFEARSSKENLISNSRDRRQNNSLC
jgi:hypothetical protein